MEKQKHPSRRAVVGLGILGTAAAASAVAVPTLKKDRIYDAETNTSPSPKPTPTPDLRTPSRNPQSTSVLINKKNPFKPVDWAPKSGDLRNPNVQLNGDPAAENMMLRNVSATALEKMATAAVAQGVALKVVSGYRSYHTQVDVYNQWVQTFGQADADIRSARPGYSEHQTGLAVDVGDGYGQDDLTQDFGATIAGQWVAQNCNNYGFIIRFPEGKQSITGYMYEPWHLRYVGAKIAKDMKAKKIITLEEYFRQPAAPSY
ncbi:MAG: M15 family metallopeptidase [Micrococcaceae bacterium]